MDGTTGQEDGADGTMGQWNNGKVGRGGIKIDGTMG